MQESIKKFTVIKNDYNTITTKMSVTVSHYRMKALSLLEQAPPKSPTQDSQTDWESLKHHIASRAQK